MISQHPFKFDKIDITPKIIEIQKILKFRTSFGFAPIRWVGINCNFQKFIPHSSLNELDVDRTETVFYSDKIRINTSAAQSMWQIENEYRHIARSLRHAARSHLPSETRIDQTVLVDADNAYAICAHHCCLPEILKDHKRTISSDWWPIKLGSKDPGSINDFMKNYPEIFALFRDREPTSDF